MNSKWLPWIMTTLVTLALTYVTYANSRMDKVNESQLTMHKEYVTRLEYDKDYTGFCHRFSNLEELIKDTNKKIDRMLVIVKNNR